MVLFPVTLSDPFWIAFHMLLVMEIEASNSVGRLTIASASQRQTVPERGVVRSRGPFTFWWAPTMSRKRLQVELSRRSSQVLST